MSGKHYVIDENKSMVEAMSKTEIIDTYRWKIFDEGFEVDETKTLTVEFFIDDINHTPYSEFLCSFFLVNQASNENVKFSIRIYKDDNDIWRIRNADSKNNWNPQNVVLADVDDYDIQAAQNTDLIYDRLKFKCYDDDPDPYYLAYKVEPLY